MNGRFSLVTFHWRKVEPANQFEIERLNDLVWALKEEVKDQKALILTLQNFGSKETH